MNDKPAFLHMINLASDKLGAIAISCSDDFFASMDNLIKAGRGVFIPDKYTEHGKWMDGWESRRKREPGHDWCIIKLGAAGIIHGVDVDTNHFLGNHPPHCSLDACNSVSDDISKAKWHEILPKVSLDPGSQHLFEINNKLAWTHVRLNIYPDGGVARLKVYGEVEKDWSVVSKNDKIDLASAKNGAKCVLCNDMFFSHMDNLIMPGRGLNMGDGWETKRNRTANNRDWVILRLAHRGLIEEINIDTRHFKGNYPDSCLLEACNLNDGNLDNAEWKVLLPQSKLSADKEHIYKNEMLFHEAVTHVRLSIFPDGGVSRLRLMGSIFKRSKLDEFNELDKLKARDQLSKCCGSTKWVDSMLSHFPFKSIEILQAKADEVWQVCEEADALEAFAHHPKIGDRESIVKKFESTKEWASDEQKGMGLANDEMIDRLAKGNIDYERKFGYIFIVFATGKSAMEMLDILEKRLTNEPGTELKIAMEEQHKITKLRLNKLFQ
jgi:allantoicase